MKAGARGQHKEWRGSKEKRLNKMTKTVFKCKESRESMKRFEKENQEQGAVEHRQTG